MRVLLLLAVASAFTLATFATAGAVEPNGTGKDNIPAGLSSGGRCGGDGGDRTTTLTCPDGQYIGAIRVRWENYVDEFSIACRAPGGPLGEYMSGGPGHGRYVTGRECQGGRIVGWIVFNSGIWVDKVLKFRCGTKYPDTWGTPVEDFAINAGGDGGSWCELGCPASELLVKIEIKQGGWVDSIRGYCRR